MIQVVFLFLTCCCLLTPQFFRVYYSLLFPTKAVFSVRLPSNTGLTNVSPLSLFLFGLFGMAVWGFGLCTHLNCFPQKEHFAVSWGTHDG